jgi:oxygen-independent coproporphyrinogen-3 oxidase
MSAAITIRPPAGLYVHLPFCRRKCAYCDFFSITDGSLIDGFISALGREVDLTLSTTGLKFDSIYIGGGTPSMIKDNQISEIIELINKKSYICINSEITIEVNPESVTRPWLEAVRAAGVNRVSIGVQSFDDGALAFLGRLHSARQAEKAFDAARAAGFDQISLDIIYGLPGQTRTDLAADLRQAMALAPEHISCYLLTIESGTPLAAALRRKKFQPLPEALIAEMYLTVSETLTANGYLHYEISNFSRDADNRSRHNLKYWRRVPYLGLGPSAHSCTGPERYWNVRNVSDYVERLTQGRSPRLTGENLTTRQHMMEALYLGLRLEEGLDMDEFNREFTADFQALFRPVLAACQADGLLTATQGRCRPTLRGMLFHETIVASLVGCF